MKLESVKLYNFFDGFKGARNAFKSWANMDSSEVDFVFEHETFKCYNFITFGEADFKLFRSLTKAGPEHRKFLRQWFVKFNLTLSLTTWKQFSTYQVGVTKNSESTMHTIMSRSLTKNDFLMKESMLDADLLLDTIIDKINYLIKQYKENTKLTPKEKQTVFDNVTDLLPSSFLQMRTVSCNYENLINIYNQRKNHRLNEWKDFCKELESFPYFMDTINL